MIYWEERVQRRTVAFWKAVRGATVYDLSQRRKTRQDLGLPDLIIVLERFRVTVFQEVKSFTDVELHSLVLPERWPNVWKDPKIWRATMMNANLYVRALDEISPDLRLELYRKMRSAEQCELERQLIGQLGIVYCVGGLEEAFETHRAIENQRERHQ